MIYPFLYGGETVGKKCRKKKKQYELFCPYCGSRAVLSTYREVYGLDATDPDEKIYVCRNFRKGCNSYVRTQKGTDIPLGVMADAKLRNMRIHAHRRISEIVDKKIMDKRSVYHYLESSFGFAPGTFHLAASGEYYCMETIRLLDQVLAAH